MEDFGSAFTGQSAGGVEPAQAEQQWDSWLQRPGNRSALLQMGLQMMQPVGIGQTAGGHIAQSIGAGGEALARADTMDLKERMADAKMQAADERLRISQQQADAQTLRATSAASKRTEKKVGGLTDLFKANAARRDMKDWEKQLDKDAAAIEKRANGTDALINPDDPVVKQYKGQTREQIRDSLRATRKKPKFGEVPSNDDDDDDDDAGGASTQPTAPTAPAGFQQYSDGNYYKADPANPGKYLRWRP